MSSAAEIIKKSCTYEYVHGFTIFLIWKPKRILVCSSSFRGISENRLNLCANLFTLTGEETLKIAIVFSAFF